jgi:ketosteroid isomerase-like protein
MAQSVIQTIKLEELIRDIWARGESKGEYERETPTKGVVFAIKKSVKRDGPRFCIDPDFGELRFKNKEITHYDFEWKKLGKVAVLKLYQGKEDGKVTYGAVQTPNIKFVGKVKFLWVEKNKDGHFMQSK